MFFAAMRAIGGPFQVGMSSVITGADCQMRLIYSPAPPPDLGSALKPPVALNGSEVDFPHGLSTGGYNYDIVYAAQATAATNAWVGTITRADWTFHCTLDGQGATVVVPCGKNQACECIPQTDPRIQSPDPCPEIRDRP
jgi:hypothetical protein